MVYAWQVKDMVVGVYSRKATCNGTLLGAMTEYEFQQKYRQDDMVAPEDPSVLHTASNGRTIRKIAPPVESTAR